MHNADISWLDVFDILQVYVIAQIKVVGTAYSLSSGNTRCS